MELCVCVCVCGDIFIAGCKKKRGGGGLLSTISSLTIHSSSTFFLSSFAHLFGLGPKEPTLLLLHLCSVKSTLLNKVDLPLPHIKWPATPKAISSSSSLLLLLLLLLEEEELWCAFSQPEVRANARPIKLPAHHPIGCC